MNTMVMLHQLLTIVHDLNYTMEKTLLTNSVWKLDTEN